MNLHGAFGHGAEEGFAVGLAQDATVKDDDHAGV